VTDADDEYRSSAEYVELLSRPAWEALRPLVTAALSGTDPGDGPIVDIGAGTGLGTLVAARAVPGAEVVALEPSLPLRTALFARTAADPALAGRVTVVPRAFPTELPSRAGAVIAMNMLGHLAPPERWSLWAWLDSALGASGRAVVNLLPPAAVEASKAAPVTVELGCRRYVGSGRAEPTGPDAVVWRMSYRTYEGDALVDQASASYRWWVLSGQALGEELAASGLVARSVGACGVFVITR